MTSSNGNIFRVTGLLWREFTDHRWIVLTKASDAEPWCFVSSAPEKNDWVNNRKAGDLRRHRTHYDITVKGNKSSLMSWHQHHITYIVILYVCSSHWSCSFVSGLLILRQFCTYTWLSTINCKWNTPFVPSHKPLSIPESLSTYLLSQIAVVIIRWLHVPLCINNILIAILILTLNFLIGIIYPSCPGKNDRHLQAIFSDAFSRKKGLIFWLK